MATPLPYTAGMFTLRPMLKKDFDEVAELIFLSTNSWYQKHLGFRVFEGDPADCRIFCEVYEDLDPDCGLVVENSKTGMIVGSCFFHPRETHVSLGIMNVHPNYFGKKIAARILRKIIEEAELRQLPLRLISSAMNLDSYSLYSRFGFRPCDIYQDLIVSVPKGGLGSKGEESSTVREAELSDLVAMGRVEFEVCGISREQDYCYFLENKGERWRTLVSEDDSGEVDGFLVSLVDPRCRMIGPGVSRTSASAKALMRSQLNLFAGKTIVFRFPAKDRELIDAAYDWGAKNCEMHYTQVRGDAQPVVGVVMPTFLPESA